ncbi:MAG: SGNH/GDSL hydrolase family protein [Lachnospiraceae bacterium]|uniref:SGNH/GDSL hydrolase family protein n=1 Tax=Candidatus Merdisoma sp. JLR.KK006 TaxID=3112626 RepID=UPI002FF24BF3|nr:SGNH/GDSL hydrolase family protein [Lachnospiraceae bacterium]
MIDKKLRPLLAVFALLLSVLLFWNISLQRELEKYKPQVEAYLPGDIYVAVGSTIELYNNQVAWTGIRDGYSFNWDCQVGENLEDRFSVTGKEEQIGDYPLTLTIYDYNINEVLSFTSVLHVVDQVIEGEFSVMNMGDSLSNGREWYRTIFYLSDGQITFTGTRGWEKYSHEGRSGFSAEDYLNPTEYFSQGDSEGVHPFYDPVQNMFDWNYYKMYTGKNPDVIQIFLGTNGLKDDPSKTVDAIAQMVKNIRKYDKEIPIYLVNTIYWAEQEKIGTMVRQDGMAFLPGEFKNRSDKRIMDLMKAMDKKFGSMDGVTLIPLALMHNSKENFQDGDALHPGEAGDQQFAEVMYSVYCGTLEH